LYFCYRFFNILFNFVNSIPSPRLRGDGALSCGQVAYSGTLCIFSKVFSGELVNENGVPKI
jgi:hypothetical protein